MSQATTTARYPRARRVNANASVPLKFDQRLVLNQWMLSLFEVDNSGQLAQMLKDSSLEGFDEDNISLFHHRLATRLFERQKLSAQQLLEYDQNIVRHWQAITKKRNLIGHPLYPKYFQYLSLLFTELYLDHYFHNPAKLLADLNGHVAEFNTDKPQSD